MVVKVKSPDTKEKEWDNPTAPEATSDDRDKEQIIRQYKEAKRRKDNLSTTEEPNQNDNNNDI